MIAPSDHDWQSPVSFVRSSVERLQNLSYLSPRRSEDVRRAFDACESTAGILIVTPGVEIVAVRR